MDGAAWTALHFHDCVVGCPCRCCAVSDLGLQPAKMNWVFATLASSHHQGDRYDPYFCTYFADCCACCWHLDPDYAEGAKLHRCHLPYRGRGYGAERHLSFHPLTAPIRSAI